MLVTCTSIDKTQQAELFEAAGETIQLEIKASVLKRLFEERQICAADFQCLDCPSKQCVKKLCLQTCLN